MKTPPDYSTWYTKQQACDAIGVSLKTVDVFVKDGRIQRKVWRRPSGGQPVAVFAPDDVQQVARERQADKAFVLAPASTKGTNGNGLMVGHATGGPVIGPVGHTVDSALAAIGYDIKVLQESRANRVIDREFAKQFLTIPEAAAFSGMSETLIRRECHAGRLVAMKDGGWKVLRSSLLEWRPV